MSEQRAVEKKKGRIGRPPGRKIPREVRLAQMRQTAAGYRDDARQYRRLMAALDDMPIEEIIAAVRDARDLTETLENMVLDSPMSDSAPLV